MFLPNSLTCKDPVQYGRLDHNNNFAYATPTESERVSARLDYLSANGGFDYYRLNDDLACFEIDQTWYIASCHEVDLNLFIETLSFDKFGEIMQDPAGLKEALEELKEERG